MNKRVNPSRSPKPAKRLLKRNGFVTPALPWLLILAPTLLLLVQLGRLAVREYSAREFLEQEAKTRAVLLENEVVSGPLLRERSTEISANVSTAIASLRDRLQYYGLTRMPQDKGILGSPEALAALNKDAEPLFRLIEQSIADKQNAAWFASALVSDLWLFDVRLQDAASRRDGDAMLETMQWAAALWPSHAGDQVTINLHKWMQMLLQSTAIDSGSLREIATRVLTPINIESQMNDYKYGRRHWLLSLARERSLNLTATDLQRWYLSLDSIRVPDHLSQMPINGERRLFRELNRGPFDHSLSDHQLDQWRFNAYRYMAVQSALEDRRRMLWLGVAARLRANETGTLPVSLDELTLNDSQIPLLKHSIWGGAFALGSYPDQQNRRRSAIYLERLPAVAESWVAPTEPVFLQSE